MKPYKTGQGNWQLNYTLDGRQRTLSLGRGSTAVAAEKTAKIVTELVSVRKMGEVPPTDLLHRVGTLSPKIRTSLEKGGLIQACFGMSVGELWEKFLEARSHLKKSTLSTYCSDRKHVIREFGLNRLVSTISRNDAENFISGLRKKLAICSVSPMSRRFHCIFEFAVNRGFLSKNPFDFTVERADTNEARREYIEPEKVRKVLLHCKNDRERLALALGRFAGVRVPSELFGLRYCDFGDEVIRIAEDTKTGFREVPILGDVREAFNRLSGKPDELVFTNGRSWYRSFLLRAIERSGETRWAKLWNNLRSSCITDFSRMGYDEKTLDSIFGNTARVRKIHYVQFDKQRSYARVIADADRIFSADARQSAVIQDLIPLLREFFTNR